MRAHRHLALARRTARATRAGDGSTRGRMLTVPGARALD